MQCPLRLVCRWVTKPFQTAILKEKCAPVAGSIRIRALRWLDTCRNVVTRKCDLRSYLNCDIRAKQRWGLSSAVSWHLGLYLSQSRGPRSLLILVRHGKSTGSFNGAVSTSALDRILAEALYVMDRTHCRSVGIIST